MNQKSRTYFKSIFYRQESSKKNDPGGRDQIEQKSPSKMFYNIDNKNVKSDDL